MAIRVLRFEASASPEFRASISSASLNTICQAFANECGAAGPAAPGKTVAVRVSAVEWPSSPRGAAPEASQCGPRSWDGCAAWTAPAGASRAARGLPILPPCLRSSKARAEARPSGSPVSDAPSRSASYSRARDKASCNRPPIVGAKISSSRPPSGMFQPVPNISGTPSRPSVDMMPVMRFSTSARPMTWRSPLRIWDTSWARMPANLRAGSCCAAGHR